MWALNSEHLHLSILFLRFAVSLRALLLHRVFVCICICGDKEKSAIVKKCQLSANGKKEEEEEDENVERQNVRAAYGRTNAMGH